MALQMLDVLIGVVVVFVVFSSAASMLAELVEIMFQRRGKLLERALKQMFAAGQSDAPDPEKTQPLLSAFYNSPAMFALFDGVHGSPHFRLPAEIPPTRFAAALIRLARGDDTPQRAQFKAILKPILDLADIDIAKLESRAQVDVEQIEQAIVDYYQTSMQRVSGWYRRHVQIVLLASGCGLAALMNVDTLAIIRALSVDDGLRTQLVSSAEGLKLPDTPICTTGSDDDTEACELARRRAFDERLRIVGGYGLPIGWGVESPPSGVMPKDSVLARRWAWLAENPQRALEKLLGLLLTGLAAALGAPYWFELLQKLLAARRAIAGAADAVAARR